MTVHLHTNVIRLTGTCRLEDVEPFAELLIADRSRAVDFSDCTQLHTAMLQLVLAFKPAIAGRAANSLINSMVLLAIDGQGLMTHV